jgi:hypothetical protein
MLNRRKPSSRQPKRQPWTMETLVRERALALSNSVDVSTSESYGSALNSWIAFIRMHHFPIEPNPDTLSFFVVYMSHYIRPKSVKSYLSGLVQQLEPDYPSVRTVRHTRLVVKVMKGCMKARGQAVRRKLPLSFDDLCFVNDKFISSPTHNDLLFAALLITGFHGLLRLGEMTFPDSCYLRDWRKVTKRSTLVIQQHQYEFLLPGHKADRFFEGNRVLISSFSSSFDPFPIFYCYLWSRDRLFPAASPLWLTATGHVPTRSFFMSRFRKIFPTSFAGASMRAGGATHLAFLRTPPELIRAVGRWTSEAWEVYIRVHLTLLHALLHHH